MLDTVLYARDKWLKDRSYGEWYHVQSLILHPADIKDGFHFILYFLNYNYQKLVILLGKALKVSSCMACPIQLQYSVDISCTCEGHIMFKYKCSLTT